MLFYFTSEQNEIRLVINGPGVKYFINNSFYLEPSEVIVNGVKKLTCKKYCDLADGLNNITIKFSEKINSSEIMFRGMTNIVEIDLSKLDISGVTNMSEMFYGCSNLENITFGNTNTSSVTNMYYLFYACKRLTSIDISYFDTSSVTIMARMFSECESLLFLDASNFNTENVERMNDMFSYCYKLKSVNVSSFNTSKVINMQGMFYQCKDLKYLDLSNFNTPLVTNAKAIFARTSSLKYLNIYSFKIVEQMEINNIFLSTSISKICINDSHTQTLLYNEQIIYDCGDICFNKNIKINLKDDSCVENCSEQDYQYEYKQFCYEQCPNDTYRIEDSFLCLDNTQKGYYLDNVDYKYKECYKTCKTCNKAGNDKFHNCQECKTDYFDIDENRNKILYEFNINDSINCIQKCPKGEIKPENNNINNKHLCRPNCTKEQPYEILYTQECVNICPFDKIKENKCMLNYKTENIVEDETKTKNDILRNYEQGFTSPDFNTSNLENGADEIYEHDGITITLTTTKNQKNNENSNMTLINLGKCESLLRKKYSLSYDDIIYMKKIDVVQEGMQIPKVEFDVYVKSTSNNLVKLSLSVC